MKKEKKNLLEEKYYKRVSNRSIKKTLRHTFSIMIFSAAVLVLLCSAGLQYLHYANRKNIDGPVNFATQAGGIEEDINKLESFTYKNMLGMIEPEEVEKQSVALVNEINAKIDSLEAEMKAFKDDDVTDALVYIDGLRKAVSDYSEFGEFVGIKRAEGEVETSLSIFSQYAEVAEQAVEENITGLIGAMKTKQDEYVSTINGVIMTVGIELLAVALACIITSIFIVRNLCSFMDGSMEEVLYALKKISEGDLNAAISLEGDNEFVTIAKDITKTIENIKLYIEKENEALSQMAAKDMTANIDIEFAGDFAPMKQAVNDITSKYNEFLMSTRDAATDVTGAANNMSSVSQNLATASTQQAASIQELLAIIENLNDNVAKVADAAQSMSKTSMEDNQEVLQGNEKMNELLEAMGKIEKSSKMIYNIIDMIEEIARKTSMLSLNATIEAARAGEEGRGFAVVAEEIRALADASADAVHKISDLVESSLEAVEYGSGIAKDTASLFSNIVKNGESHVEMTQGISNDCSNQSQTLHSVLCGVQEIAATVESNTQLAEEASATSEQLFASAQYMNDGLQLFKLRENVGKEA